MCYRNCIDYKNFLRINKLLCIISFYSLSTIVKISKNAVCCIFFFFRVRHFPVSSHQHIANYRYFSELVLKSI